MSNLEVTSAGALRIERIIGWRWLRRAARALLLAMHDSRRRQARRIVREFSHLRDGF
jgi:hypothetical protein